MFSLRKPLAKGTLRRKLCLNNALWLALVLLVILGTYFYLFYSNSKQIFELRVAMLANTSATLIDAQAHDRLLTRADENSAEYREILKILQGIQKGNLDITDIYTIRRSGKGEKWEYVVDVRTEEPVHIGEPYNTTGNDTLKKAYFGPIGLRDEGLFGYAPIKNNDGETVGLVGLHINPQNLYDQERKLAIWALLISILSLGFLFYVTNKQIKSLTHPIEKMIAGINRFRAGDYEHRYNAQTGNEFETLENALNEAADIFRDQQRMIEQDLQNTRMQKEKIFNVYRDVIYAVTQGKFHLLNDAELELIKDEGVLQEEVIIAALTDVNAAREAIAAYLKKTGCSQQDLAHIVLSVSEATTNAIKHAGSGAMQIRALDQGVRVCVSDQGPGMDFDKLPNMIFLQGFSTKISLGYGFSIIYRFADKISLSTSEHGTYVAMDFLIHMS